MGSVDAVAKREPDKPEEVCVNWSGSVAVLDEDDLPSSSVTQLTIDCSGLGGLPEKFGQHLCNLTFLSLCGNEFSMVPASFKDLSKLEELHLANNQLTSFPEWCSKHWKRLKVLNLSENSLGTLPYTFGEMDTLETLLIEENQLKKLPPTFGLLRRLQVLEAGHNQLETVPDSIGLLANLRLINLGWNKLERLPEALGTLESLECLEVSENRLRKLPSSFQSLHTLKKLFADGNVDLCCPGWLEDLTAIEEISMTDTHLEGEVFGENFGRRCWRLRRGHFGGNCITSLPESVGEAASLEVLHLGSLLPESQKTEFLSGNRLYHLPASFCRLSALQELNLEENCLHELPDLFGDLRNLRLLNLGRNQISELPETFSHLGSLEECVLSKNSLTLLPSNFGQLSNLRVLRLDSNLLCELPESFVELRKLHSLDLFENRLQELPACLQQLSLTNLDLTENPMDLADSERNVSASSKKFQCTAPDPELSSGWRGGSRQRQWLQEGDDKAWSDLTLAQQQATSIWRSHTVSNGRRGFYGGTGAEDLDGEEMSGGSQAEEEDSDATPESWGEEDWEEGNAPAPEFFGEEEDRDAESETEAARPVCECEENWDGEVDSGPEPWDLLDHYQPREKVNSMGVAPDVFAVYNILFKGNIPPLLPYDVHTPSIAVPRRLPLKPEEGQFDDVM